MQVVEKVGYILFRTGCAHARATPRAEIVSDAILE